LVAHRHVTVTKNEQDEYLASDEEGDSVISALGMKGDPAVSVLTFQRFKILSATWNSTVDGTVGH
jgi:hypothetical protein